MGWRLVVDDVKMFREEARRVVYRMKDASE